MARNLARLGAQARLAGLAGQDEAGKALRQELAAEGVEEGLVFSVARRTTRKTRVIAQGQQLLRLDEEQCDPLLPEESAALREKALELLPGCGAVVLSDYGKGVLLTPPGGESLCAALIAAARRQRIPVLVDPKGGDWRRYAGTQCVTPNSSEFAAVCRA